MKTVIFQTTSYQARRDIYDVCVLVMKHDSKWTNPYLGMTEATGFVREAAKETASNQLPESNNGKH